MCLKILVIFLTISFSFAQTEPEDIDTITLNLNLKNIGRYYLKDEIFRYKVYWEFLYAGDAEMGIILEEFNNNKIYLIFTKTSSNKSLDLIYKVRNQTISYVDYNGFYSLKFFNQQDEAGKISKEYVLFDYKNNIWKELTSNTTGYISDFLQDVVSALWWLRLQDIKVTDRYKVDVYSGKIVYPMIIDVIKIEKIKISGKEYTCFKIEPKVDLKRFPLFRARGKLFVYITCDEKKIPVRLESRVLIGRVFADLVEEN